MRTLASSTIATALLTVAACNDPECLPDEYKAGATCYPKAHTADGSAAAASDGDGGKPPAAGIDGGPTSFDASHAETTPPGSDAGVDTSAAGSDTGVSVPDAEVAPPATVTPDAGPPTPPAPCPGATPNKCGGCEMLTNDPGDTCDNHGKGPCAASGTYQCSGTALVCNAPPATPTAEVCDGIDNDCNGTKDDGLPLNACQKCGPLPAEVCGDNIDNDCNGATDDPSASDAKSWYPDCDGDGYAVSAGVVKACAAPASTSSCKAWLGTAPVAGAGDCRDDSEAYHPGAPPGYSPVAGSGPWGGPSGAVRFDFDCDGKLEIATSIPYNGTTSWCPNSTGCPMTVGPICIVGDPTMIATTNCGTAAVATVHFLESNGICDSAPSMSSVPIYCH